MPKEKQPEDMTFQELLPIVEKMDLGPLIYFLEKLERFSPECQTAKKVLNSVHNLLHEEEFDV